MVYVVKVAKTDPNDRERYLRNGFDMTFTKQRRAQRFESKAEAVQYVRRHGWPKRDHGLLFVRLRPRTK